MAAEILETLIKQGPRILRYTVSGTILKIKKDYNSTGTECVVTGQFLTKRNAIVLNFIVMSGKAKEKEMLLHEGSKIKTTLNLETELIENSPNLIFWMLDIEPD